jgi:drug/metabolite transporter (DMT)-like permease
MHTTIKTSTYPSTYPVSLHSFMDWFFKTCCLVLVGALWGCTNPLLRQGVTAVTNEKQNEDGAMCQVGGPQQSKIWQWLVSTLSKFVHASVWIPYLLNQSGSVLYYISLAQSDLSVAVPICNALALVFSIGTSYLIGERIQQPAKTALGAGLVMAGVAVCLLTQNNDASTK